MEKLKLNEEQLRKIIRESIQQVLDWQNGDLLLEMAFPRKVYKEKINDVLIQILINWCLVRYCTLANRETVKSHWQGELRGHLLTASRLAIRKNDSAETRLKVLNEVWGDNDFSNPHYLNMAVCNKFLKEHIDIKSTEYEQTIIDCISDIQNIFDVILTRDIYVIRKYIETI